MGDNDIQNSRKELPAKESPRLLNDDEISTQTIYLDQLLNKDVTPSGSFDVRGEIWKSTFGKLLQALPIPAFLVDESLRITTMNQSSGRISPDYEKTLSENFQVLFPGPETASRMLAVVREVFATRKPQVAEAMVQLGQNRIAGRLTFRSIRILRERFVLVMVEDLTAEKMQLALSKKHEQELKTAYDEVEHLVKQRTAALRKANSTMKTLIAGIEQKLKDDRQMIYADLKLRVKPLLDLWKVEELPERLTLLRDSMVHALDSVLEGDSSDFVKLAGILTTREIQICDLIRSGLTSKQIGAALQVSAETVEASRANIRKKIGLRHSHERLTTWLSKL
jgi:DNA-binding CsgD family transcriptional regulator